MALFMVSSYLPKPIKAVFSLCSLVVDKPFRKPYVPTFIYNNKGDKVLTYK
jgi:hypothetical protein